MHTKSTYRKTYRYCFCKEVYSQKRLILDVSKIVADELYSVQICEAFSERATSE